MILLCTKSYFLAQIYLLSKKHSINYFIYNCNFSKIYFVDKYTFFPHFIYIHISKHKDKYMSLLVNYEKISEIFKTASNEERFNLYEYEVYHLLELSGSETVPKSFFIPKSVKAAKEELMALPGEKTVLKIVSPTIMHKTEVGGVRILEKSPEKILSAMRRMYSEIPERYADILEKDPAHKPITYKNLKDDDLTEAISKDICGILQVQFMPPDSSAFGNELIVGLRRTREFGMVISAGLGGTDTELYAQSFRKGQAIVAAPTLTTNGKEFFNLYKKTISYRKLAGLTRGQKRIVTDEQLIECFESFIQMGNYFSPLNVKSEFIIEELEINPFAFTDFLMVALDGLCRFSRQEKLLPQRPQSHIDALLHPKKLAIIGVSSTRKNFGRVILDNVIKAGYNPEDIVLIKENTDISGVSCFPTIHEVEGKIDLLVVAIDAKHVPALVDELIHSKKAKSVMLVAGGLGETEESKEIALKMTTAIQKSHQDPESPVFLGANCMGVISRHGNYDTWFIPQEKFDSATPLINNTPRSLALISQSGAFLLSRFSQVPEMNPSYLISMGNQSDLTLGDMMQYFENSDKVCTIGIYAEGFKDLDGLYFAQSVKRAVEKGKQVIFYKAGRTPEGKDATSGHTASLAGDYMVCESAIKQAGGIVARTFTEFQDLVLLAESLACKKIRGKRIAAISGAGFEAVGMADSIHSDEYDIILGTFSDETKNKMQEVLEKKNLSKLVQVSNPFDINPSSDDEAHATLARLALEDDNIDALVISLDPLSPMTHTLDNPDTPNFDFNQENSILKLIIDLNNSIDKPLIAIVDGGHQFTPFRLALKNAKIPVFTICDRAIQVLSLYLEETVQEKDKKIYNFNDIKSI